MKPKMSPAGSPGPQTRQASRAFTLLELLVVIGIVALLAALTLPVLNSFKPNYTATASRQLLDDLSRARQLAISQRTTVYMVFVPTNFWNDVAYGLNWTQADRLQATNLLDKQLVGYTFVSLRSLGDQPGRPTVRYLSPWRTLPEGAFISVAKFTNSPVAIPVASLVLSNVPLGALTEPYLNIYPFLKTNGIPFPLETTLPGPRTRPYVTLPYIAFDHMGRLVSGRDEYIPLSKGSLGVPKGADGRPVQGVVTAIEQPPGNTTNSYNLVAVDWLTGRARAVRQEVR